MGKNEVQIVRMSQESQPYRKRLQGQVNSEFEEWLNRSLVCTSYEPRDLATLSSAIINGFGQYTKICALSSFKFILTFSTIEQMEAAWSNHEELDLWFSEINKWRSSDYCECRKVWIENFGVPPHGWLGENFNRIAEIWGRVICLSKPIYRTDSFESMKVLVVTDIFQRIEDNLILVIGDEGYRIFITEIGPALPISQRNCSSPSNPAMENQDSNNDVPGFEDLDDELAEGNDVAQSDLRNVVVNDELVNTVAKSNPMVQISSNSNCEGGKAGASMENSINSVTRTKTVSFSQNGFSEEIIKISQHLQPLRNPTDSELPPPPGFENRRTVGLGENASPNAIQTIDAHLEEGEVVAPKVSVIATPRELQPSAVRFNNSLEEGPKNRSIECQAHAGLGKVKSANQQPQIPAKGHSATVSSTYTSDSIRKIAEEALHIGELLGVKVVQHKQGAVSRITETLKKSRVSKAKRVGSNKGS